MEREAPHLDEELWGQAVEDAIDEYITNLVIIAQAWADKANLCGCASCRRKADAKEYDKNDAIYHFFADGE